MGKRFIAGNRAFETYEQAAQYCISSDWDLEMIKAEAESIAECTKEREVDHFHCGECKHFNVNADREESRCKRIDHKTIKFAIPYFKCYDCNQHSGTICSDFEPAAWCINAVKEWKGFDEYWPNYIKQWIPYSNVSGGISFTLNGNTDIRYRVRMLDFVFGTMYDENGRLKAYEKYYYKQTRNSPTGYEIATEPINGITV